VASIRLAQVHKVYNDKHSALNNVSFECTDGEFLAILGQVGAGKTTLLRVISGLENVTRGEVYIGDQLVNQLSPEERNTAMVFETYALYPHFSVFDNIAFPLRAPRLKPRLSSEEIRNRVLSVAKMLQIADLLDRRPWQLSGGQRQRVALGRALVRNPEVFLMDEPLAHLDAKLRHHMRGELKRLQKDIAITTIYATPDYMEAMAMADHVVFLHKGEVHQYGTPADIFERPASILVAQMVGDPPMNLLEVEIGWTDGRFRLKTKTFALDAPSHLNPLLQRLQGQDRLILGIRPTDLVPSLEPNEEYPIMGIVHVFEPLGANTILNLRVGSDMISVKAMGTLPVGFDDKVWLKVRPESIHLFEARTGRRLGHDSEGKG
jgi:multiple sugar transport system ATP-binding protein